MIAGTVKSSPRMFSMSACSASSRCCPSIARRMPSRSGTLSLPTTAPLSTASNVSFSSHEMMTAPGIEGRSRACRHCS
ncbi:hypothetical protein D3C83_36850 [compost metagenome]